MRVTIYHNPKCSKSRQTLALLQEKGIEPKVVEYMNTSLETDGIWYKEFPEQKDGKWSPFKDKPGLGLELDPYAVEKWST